MAQVGDLVAVVHNVDLDVYIDAVAEAWLRNGDGLTMVLRGGESGGCGLKW